MVSLGGHSDEEQSICILLKVLPQRQCLCYKGGNEKLLHSGNIRQHLDRVVKITVTDEDQMGTAQLQA